MKIILILLFMVTSIFANDRVKCVKLKDQHNKDVYINVNMINYIKLSEAHFRKRIIIILSNEYSIYLSEKYKMEQILKLLNWEIIND